MAQAAYALRADRDLDCVGTIVVDTSRAINVRALLEEHGGTYVTEDDAEITALDDYDPVKRISLAEAEEQQKATAKPAKAPKAESKES